MAGFAWNAIGSEVNAEMESLTVKSNQGLEQTGPSSEPEKITRPVRKFGVIVGREEVSGKDPSGKGGFSFKVLEGARARMKTLQEYPGKQEALWDSLLSRGLKPQAILPAALWDSMCRKFSLFRFEHLNEAGETGMDPRSKAVVKTGLFLNAGLTLAFWILNLPIFAFAFSLCLAVCLMDLFDRRAEVPTETKDYALFDWASLLVGISSLFAGGAAFAFLASGPLALLLGIAGFALMVCYYFYFASHIFPLILRRLSSETLYKLFWPRGVDAEADSGEEEPAKRIKINFKTEPHSGFVDHLNAIHAAGFHPMIAAAVGAIGTDKQNLIEAAVDQAKRHDPILYTRHGHLVAIFDQIGEFADEKTVMDWIKNEGMNILYLELAR